MLINNIVVDYLRSCRYDYTYAVFMRECGILSEDLVNKNALGKLIKVDKEVFEEERFNVSLI